MPDENPYAAPQTSPQNPADELLPVAEPATGVWERQQFPDCDSERLWLLEARSRAIADIRWVWLMLLFIEMPVGYLVSFLAPSAGSVDPTPLMIWMAVFLLTLGRFVAGFFRTRTIRLFSIIMDGLLTAATVSGTLVILFGLLIRPNAGYLFFIAILGLMSVIGWRSCKAAVLAPELFEAGEFPHKLLLEEADYRREHQIA